MDSSGDDIDVSTGWSSTSRTDLSRRRPVVQLRTTLSNSSLRLAYTGGVLHHSSSIDNIRISAGASTPSAMPSFADTTMRWSGPTATGLDHNQAAFFPQPAPAPAPAAAASTGFAHCFETPTKITIPRRAVLSGVDDSEWSPPASFSSSSAAPALSPTSPTSPQQQRRGSSSGSGSGSGSGSPRRRRGRHSSKGRSRATSSIDHDSCSDEELERELMEDHYSSLEQVRSLRLPLSHTISSLAHRQLPLHRCSHARALRSARCRLQTLSGSRVSTPTRQTRPPPHPRRRKQAHPFLTCANRPLSLGHSPARQRGLRLCTVAQSTHSDCRITRLGRSSSRRRPLPLPPASPP